MIIKDIISDRLLRLNNANNTNNTSNINDRKILNDVLYDVHAPIAKDNMLMYKNLEDNLYNEVLNRGKGKKNSNIKSEYAIYTSLDYLENQINSKSKFLHPMVSSDLDIKQNNAAAIIKTQAVIASMFMKCSNSDIMRMLNENDVLEGSIKTNKDEYAIEVKIKKCTKYIKKIEELYKAFKNNNLDWITVNCPYAYKFIDIVLITAISIEKDEKVEEIAVSFGSYDQYVYSGVIPVWNVKTISLEETSFPNLVDNALDAINIYNNWDNYEDRIGESRIYEHHISLDGANMQNGYLVTQNQNNPSYFYLSRQENELVIATDNEGQSLWELFQIEDYSSYTGLSGLTGESLQSLQTPAFKMFSNKRNLGFIGRFVAASSIVIRTKGELARLLNSYEQSKTVPFYAVQILDTFEQVEETTDYNKLISVNGENIRVDKYKKIMLLQFKITDSDNEPYLIYDKISFLTSEAQKLYPEYHCIGEYV